MTHWEELAETLRGQLRENVYRPGDVIPREVDLIETTGHSRTTVRRAVDQLVAEGRLQRIRRRGTVVRHRPPRIRIVRTRCVYRDERGYYFDPIAKDWVALQTPTVSWGPCPYDVAGLLGVEPGDEVLIRDRVIGEPDTRIVRQLATSYLPAAVARGTILAEADTGVGGIYDRMEQDLGYGPLNWEEGVGARQATDEEAKLLDLAPYVSVLRLIRTTTSADGRPLEVNDTRLDSERYEVGHPIARDASAAV